MHACVLRNNCSLTNMAEQNRASKLILYVITNPNKTLPLPLQCPLWVLKGSEVTCRDCPPMV